MGAWGYKLYQDDVACDVKDDYLNSLRIGMTNEEATYSVIQGYESEYDYDEDEMICYFVLADIQWKYGRLLPEIRDKAIYYIDSEKDLERWDSDIDLYNKRKNELIKLKDKLLTPQPPMKNVSKLKVIRAKFNVGDLLLYQIKNEELKNHKWYGKFVALRIVGYNRSRIGGLPFDKYYNECNISCIYNLVSTNPTFSYDIPNMRFIDSEYEYNVPFYCPKYKNNEEKCKLFNFLSFNKKELNYLDFKVILNDENYPHEEYFNETSNVVNIGYDTTYSLDFSIIQALERAERGGYLIEL